MSDWKKKKKNLMILNTKDFITKKEMLFAITNSQEYFYTVVSSRPQDMENDWNKTEITCKKMDWWVEFNLNLNFGLL